jgi:hypothetical protein
VLSAAFCPRSPVALSLQPFKNLRSLKLDKWFKLKEVKNVLADLALLLSSCPLFFAVFRAIPIEPTEPTHPADPTSFLEIS